MRSSRSVMGCLRCVNLALSHSSLVSIGGVEIGLPSVGTGDKLLVVRCWLA